MRSGSAWPSLPFFCRWSASEVLPVASPVALERSCLIPPWGISVPYVRNQPARHPPRACQGLKRADGHLRHVIEMIEAGRPCHDIAVQLQAVEKAVSAAKRTLIHDHIDHCIGRDGAADLTELRALAKLL